MSPACSILTRLVLRPHQREICQCLSPSIHHKNARHTLPCSSPSTCGGLKASTPTGTGTDYFIDSLWTGARNIQTKPLPRCGRAFNPAAFSLMDHLATSLAVQDYLLLFFSNWSFFCAQHLVTAPALVEKSRSTRMSGESTCTSRTVLSGRNTTVTNGESSSCKAT